MQETIMYCGFSLSQKATLPLEEIPAIPSAGISLKYDSTTNQVVDEAKHSLLPVGYDRQRYGFPIVSTSVSQNFFGTPFTLSRPDEKTGC